MHDCDSTELLAPAGDWDALKAAVANGADAVYFGLGDFNARHRATNFSMDELPGVLDYLHAHNTRGYVTFNTLIYSDELSAASEYAAGIARAGADAVIVQDLGLAALIHRMAPSLPIHASTQMTLTDARGMALAAELGVQRVILARELSLDQIRTLAHESPMPLEVFVHGALCVAYSGQCLTSESLGGRSANRGRCAQACRLPYDLIVDGVLRDMGEQAYLLSPQDLAAVDLVKPLVAAGVSGLKIEGRLKSSHYVAAATQAYRAALDAALSDRPFQLSRQGQLDLSQSFSRGFSSGFLRGPNHQVLVPGRFPKNRGVLLGTVLRMTLRGVVIAANNPVKPGDGVVFDQGHPDQDEQGGRIFYVNEPRDSIRSAAGREVELVLGPGDINLAAIAAGAKVWKTDDPAMRRRLEQSFSREKVVRRIPLSVKAQARVGQPLVLVFQAHNRQVEVRSDAPLPQALKHPLGLELLRDQLGRLGDTPYELSSVELEGDGDATGLSRAMVPKSMLNDLRRQAVEELLRLRAADAAHPLQQPQALEALRIEAVETPQAPAAPGGLSVLVRSMEQLEAVLALAGNTEPGLPQPGLIYCEFEDARIYPQALELARAAGIAMGLATLRIVKPGEDGFLRHIAQCRPDVVLARSLSAIAFFRQTCPQLPVVADYALNAANELTAAVLARMGVARLTPSYDLNAQQLQALAANFPANYFEAVIHQHMPMFHMEHCVFAATLSQGKDYRDCGRPCEHHRVELRHRDGLVHPLLADAGCRNTLYNATAQSAADYLDRMKTWGWCHFRVELLREDGSETQAILNHYARVLAGKEEPREARRAMRVLNQLGVTTGTLGYSE